jgi:aspartate racemase
MKVIGLMGGMSWESTAHDYGQLNKEVRARLGGLHSAETLMWSVDFAPIAQMQAAGQWEQAGARLARVARKLEAAGAEVLVLATNTMHKVVAMIEAAISIPLLHIADATGERIKVAGRSRPALVATQFAMEQDFYVGRLRDRFGLDVIVPEESDRTLVHRIIYDELCVGQVTDASRRAHVEVSSRLAARGADCLILGCTDVGMLLDSSNAPLPFPDTTLIHAHAAVDFALGTTVALQAAE